MVLKQMPDVLCFNCTEKGGMEISKVLAARPVGTYSNDGPIRRFRVVEVPKLTCWNCEYEAVGHWDGPNHAVFPDPHA